MEQERVPVLVVGGGYAGLSTATLLAWRDVPVMLVEKHPSTSIQPKAFGVGPRAIELLRPVPGIEQELRETWAGIGDSMRMAIAKSLAESMGCRLDVQSAPGEGARFEVAFPA